MIKQYGWSDALAEAFAPHAHADHVPGRIVAHHRDGYQVATDEGELRAVPPRYTTFVRRAADRVQALPVIAANAAWSNGADTRSDSRLLQSNELQQPKRQSARRG